jgi:hypothetical protein
MVRINTKVFDKRMNELQDLPQEAMKKALPVTKSNTPIREGNARRRTKLSSDKLTINSNYSYAGRLDDGWSKQSPKGFTKPTINALRSIVDKLVRRV